MRLRGNCVGSQKAKGPEISLQPLRYLVAPAGLESATRRSGVSIVITENQFLILIIIDRDSH